MLLSEFEVIHCIGKPGRPSCTTPPSDVVLHAQARSLDEPGGNLAQYSGPQAAQTRQFPLAGRLARPNLGLHRLFTITRWPNPSNGRTRGLLNRGVFSASVY